MHIERLEDLIDWTRQTHQHLARCLAGGADQQPDTLGAWLLAHLARHEAALADTLRRIEQHAQREALQGWIRDRLAQNPLPLAAHCAAFGDMPVERITRELDATHQHILGIYRQLAAQAPSDEASALLADLLSLEEQQSSRLLARARQLDEL